LNVTIWNEFRHERQEERIAKVYPKGIHMALKDAFPEEEFTVRTATLDEPECGLPESVLNVTDVLIWWGHMAHQDVPDDLVKRLAARVHCGMGVIFLHSAHGSKLFTRLMGTPCYLKWREADERERIWCVNPGHEIAAGLGEYFELPMDEMYGEPFSIPQPDELVFVTWFQGGEVMRSGCCWRRGYGKVFYFQPGHESYPIYYDENVRTVIRNAVRWAYNPIRVDSIGCPNVSPIETL
jgi:trehalose utilization protein